MEITRLLSDLKRLEVEQSNSDGDGAVPHALRQFAVVSASPLALDSVEIVPQNTAVDSKISITTVFSTPALTSPYANPDVAKRELEKQTRPLFALENLSPYPTGSYVFPEPHASRFLAQMPMSNTRIELVPKRSGMVLNPLDLSYEFRPIDTSRLGVDAGFSSALTKQDEYARGKMTNKPFSPGGDSLVDLDNDGASVAIDAQGLLADGAVFSSPEEQARNALVLGDSLDLDDYDMLERLVFSAPGLDGCLTVDDVRELEKAPFDSPAQREDDDMKSENTLEVVGVNPDGLLKPYFQVAADREHVEAIRRIVADEKASGAMAQADNQSGTMALDELLHDLEDDDDLGFYVEDDSNEQNDKDEEEEKESEAATVGATEVEGGAPSSEDDGAIGEPEAELEAILASGTGSSKLARQSSSAIPTSEWASIASVDVRNFHEKVPDMAIKYDFELDTFQKECVIHLERHECVFVAAHTSAGKTVVAEYAIAMSQKHMTRTIYTSPIKALSNQKYRDFRTKFGPENVGLITGDVSINPEASCLVMTTEILRSMLYRGADVIRDIEWVIFDEIHYINDSERGVVWEEVIIMLPEHIGMVFLSATTPNHLEFSDWIGRTKKKKIHVISTTKRPVPLQHFLYAGKELFKLYDASHGYLPGAYSAAKTKLFPPSDKPKPGAGRGGGSSIGGGSSSGGSRNMGRTSGGDQSEWTKLITSLKDKALLPVVVFAFSKKLCEESANKLSKLDLSTPSERSEIHLFLEASIQRLQGTDRELPQVLTMKEMLKRGIGVHHGGLLPIIKEMVEILFGRGLVKVLFSTETFAMGVNMPARTVVFNGIRKHDGKSFRDLLPGEYTQMAGRAGRRGLDLVGTVIISCWNDVPEPTSLQTMLAGKATSLSSQFRLTYNMILNLLRVEVLTVEDMMKRSFSEFQTQKALASKNIPQLILRGRKLLKQLDAALREEYPHLESSGELAQIQELYRLKKQKHEVEKKLTKWMLTKNANAAKNAIAPGRVLVINAKGLPADMLALVVRTNSNPLASASSEDQLLRLALSFSLDASPSSSANPGLFKSITVIFLCAEDYVPPAKAVTQPEKKDPLRFGLNNRSSSSLSSSSFGGRSLQSKRDDSADDRMFGGAQSGSKAKESKELESNTVETLLGKKYAVLDIPETWIEMVTNIEATAVNFKTLVASSSKKELASSVEFLIELEKKQGNAQKPLLSYVDVVNELKLKSLDVVTMYSDWEQLHQMVVTHPCTIGANATGGSLSRVMGKVDKMSKLNDYVTRLTRELSNDSLSLFPDFQQRLKVLKRLGYISEDGVVQVKGRVACEINTCEEIVLTEMIFENVLANLEPEEIVAVLSALIFQEKTQSEPALTPRLEEAREVVKRIAESLGLIQLEQHLDIDPAVYCKGALNFGLMEVVYEWSRGMPFKELCLLTDIQEGSIVRCITRLDEVCREVRNAARVIGDPRLFRKMEVASESIKRDVVFASSLYLT